MSEEKLYSRIEGDELRFGCDKPDWIICSPTMDYICTVLDTATYIDAGISYTKCYCDGSLSVIFNNETGRAVEFSLHDENGIAIQTTYADNQFIIAKNL